MVGKFQTSQNSAWRQCKMSIRLADSATAWVSNGVWWVSVLDNVAMVEEKTLQAACTVKVGNLWVTLVMIHAEMTIPVLSSSNCWASSSILLSLLIISAFKSSFSWSAPVSSTEIRITCAVRPMWLYLASCLTSVAPLLSPFSCLVLPLDVVVVILYVESLAPCLL